MFFLNKFFSSPEGNVQQMKMWEEVASKYQDILNREYRMLNLPSYSAMSEGNVYLYYVPVIINRQFVPQSYGVYSQYLNTAKTAGETGSKKDIIHFGDNDNMNDNCIKAVKEEPRMHYDQTIEDTGDSKGRFRTEYVSCKTESKQYNRVKSWPCSTETTVTTKAEKNTNGLNSCCGGHRKYMKNGGERENTSQNGRRKDEPFVKNADEGASEGYIRIFKGYTIEYHPLKRGKPQGCYVSELDVKRAEKIQDLKERLAEQEEELKKLKLQPSADDVCKKGDVDGCFQRKLMDNGKINDFQAQKPWKFLKEFPSTEIHYFPSGERKTSPRRKHARKQAVPRRIEEIPNIRNEKPVHINGEAKCSESEKKTKSTPFTPVLNEEKNCKDKKDKRVLREEKSTQKQAKSSKKARTGRKRRKTQQVSDKTGKKRSKVTWCKNTQDDDICIDENMCKARDPHDVTQDEFLSIFGLLRNGGQ